MDGHVWEEALTREPCDVRRAMEVESRHEDFYQTHPEQYARVLIWNVRRGRAAVVRFLLRHGCCYCVDTYAEAWGAACGLGHVSIAKMLESHIVNELPDGDVIADAFPDQFDAALLSARRNRHVEALEYLRSHDLDWHEDDAEYMYSPLPPVKSRSSCPQPYQRVRVP